jgi:hypothetical protein
MGVVGSASATLLDRGPDMVYDNVLDITWVSPGLSSGVSLPGLRSAFGQRGVTGLLADAVVCDAP